MGGSVVGRALQDRFETVRRSETQRLKRKLSGLSERDRSVAEAVIADVIRTLALLPARALSDDLHPQALKALVHLFDLDIRPTT